MKNFVAFTLSSSFCYHFPVAVARAIEAQSFGPDTIPQLDEAITAIEADEHLRVVVFDSAIPGFF